MSLNPPERRPTHLPPPDFSSRKLLLEPGPQASWLRLHSASHPAIDFNQRPGNRFTPLSGPLPVLYAGADLETCLLEKFGDALYAGPKRIAQSIWATRRVTSFSLAGAGLVDLRGLDGLSTLGVDLSSLLSSDLSVSQAWARSIMEHPQKPDGLVYPSRFTNRACLALFRRDGKAPPVVEAAASSLEDLPEAAEFLDRLSIALV